LKFELRIGPERQQLPLDQPDYSRWRSQAGELVATFHRLPEGFAIRFLDRADFLIGPTAAAVVCHPVPGVPQAAIDNLFVNQVTPILAGHGGELVIHASGSALDGSAAAFVGPTGRGKSTLAAVLARASYPFLSDDGLVLRRVGDGYLAQPNRPSFRLWSDHARQLLPADQPWQPEELGKARVLSSEALPFQREPLPLRALFFLGRGATAEVRIDPIGAREVLVELINHSFFLDAEDRARMTRHFDRLAELARTVPGFRLDYPREYASLAVVTERIVAHMGGEDKAP